MKYAIVISTWRKRTATVTRRSLRLFPIACLQSCSFLPGWLPGCLVRFILFCLIMRIWKRLVVSVDYFSCRQYKWFVYCSSWHLPVFCLVIVSNVLGNNPRAWLLHCFCVEHFSSFVLFVGIFILFRRRARARFCYRFSASNYSVNINSLRANCLVEYFFTRLLLFCRCF